MKSDVKNSETKNCHLFRNVMKTLHVKNGFLGQNLQPTAREKKYYLSKKHGKRP